MTNNENVRKNINFAIVGFGGIAKTHAVGAYFANLTLNLPYSLTLVKTVTRKPLSISGISTTQSLEEVLEDSNIDFIDICTPNDFHGEIVKKAVSYKKLIYCEKPLSSNYEEALEMAEIVKGAGVKNAVAFIYRFMPAVRLIKDEIEYGTIGEIIDFKIKLYHKSYLDSSKKGTWRTTPSSGGGALLDLGVHLIDIVHFTLGQIEKVKCNTNIFFKDRTSVDEIASCELYLENGVKGSLEVSRIFADNVEPTTFVIYGTKGCIKMSSQNPYTLEVYDYNKNMTYIKSAKGIDRILRYYPGERSSLGFAQDCHAVSIVNFANLIVNEVMEEELTPTFEDGLNAQRVVEASYRSSKNGRIVDIKEI